MPRTIELPARWSPRRPEQARGLLAVILIVGLIPVAGISVGLQAQVRDGDLLIGGMGLGQDGRILALDPVRGTWTTVVALPGYNRIVQSVGMASDNRSGLFTWYDYGSGSGGLGHVTGPGAWSTLLLLPPGVGPQAHALDMEGAWMVATRHGALLRILPPFSVQTIFQSPVGLNLDVLTDLALNGGLPILSGHIGTLDATGASRARLLVPGGLRGLRIFFAGVVLDPGRAWPGTVRTVTATVALNLP